MRFFQPSRRRTVVELAALVDVTFLLIIFLLLTTRFANESQLRVSLPEAVGTLAEQAHDNLEIVIDARGRYWVAGAPVRPVSLRTLMLEINRVAQGDRELLVQIRADERAQHRDVVRAMDAASRLGFSRVSIDVRQTDEPLSSGSAPSLESAPSPLILPGGGG